MKKYLFIIGLMFGLNVSSIAQNLNNYKYVRVPDMFDFQKDENKYRLNELLAFLLEKEDFEALYKESIPAAVSNCDILDANVHNESNLFRTKLYITLTDCNEQVVFTSETGVSRQKEYKAGFQEALRNAFKSLEALQHEYSQGPGKVIVEAVPSEEKRQQLQEESLKQEESFKEETTYSNAGKSYVLEPTSSGFELFEKNKEEQIARLIKSANGDTYLYTSEKINGNAFFDTSENLVVEYLSDGLLISLTYKKVQ
ncbi:MAG: hypothetical protein WBL21_13720 [Salinimicrobium sp.]